MNISLGELARRIDARLVGDPDIQVDRVETLDSAGPGSVSFLFNRRYRKFLEITRASAVIIYPADEPLCPVAALISEDPYLGYARAATLINPAAESEAGIHPAASVAETAKISPQAYVGAQAVIEAEAEIEEHVTVGPGCYVGPGARICAFTHLVANVSIGAGVVIGRRNLIHPGAVIGADGFGLAKDGERWLKIPQLGSVHVGDDVEIGANTTIDRGSLKDTVIGPGVKLDNQIQIGHNVRIGEHTAIAGNTAVAGSVTIGKRCTIAGCVGIIGHLEIADDTTVLAMSLVTKSIREPGTYSSSWPAAEHRQWKRRVSTLGRIAKGREK